MHEFDSTHTWNIRGREEKEEEDGIKSVRKEREREPYNASGKTQSRVTIKPVHHQTTPLARSLSLSL